MTRCIGGLRTLGTTRVSKDWWMLSRIGCEAAKQSFGGRRSQTRVWEREKSAIRGTRRFRYGDLSTNKHYVQELAFAFGSGFARNHDHPIRLFIQRAGFGAGFGFHGLLDHEFRGAFFLDDAQRAVAVRAKRLHGA